MRQSYIVSLFIILQSSFTRGYEVAFFSNDPYENGAECINHSGDLSGSGDIDCSPTNADADSQSIEITGLSSPCILTLYDNTACTLENDAEYEVYDEG
jgi:hypothetical protein